MSAVAQAIETLKAEFARESYAGDDPQAARENESAAADHRQFVIFHVQGERFGVSLSEVQEIIRVPDVVRMPLSPVSLEGLANLRGNVLPVLNLRQAFGFPSALHDDSTRVVVLNHERPVGLIVDRMANVVSVEPDQIEQASTIRSQIDLDFVSGMIKETDGRSLVIILNSRQIVAGEFASRGELASRAADESGPAAESPGAQAATADADEDQLVSFEVAGQEYAFPIETVKEIVQLPDHITEVPNTAGHILGVITLRNSLLPLVSLRAFFGMPQEAMTEANKVVVIALDGAGKTSVGVVMDRIRAVLRVKRSEVEPVPELLRGRGDDIAAICRLEEGRRLVSILSAETMFDRSEIEKLRQAGDGDMLNDASAAAAATDAVDEEQFVLFRLKGEEYGVRIDSVQEIVRVPPELTRIPNCPDFIEGVINLRGAVLPVVDQRRRFRQESIERNDRQRIMVFTLNGVKTGFIVDFVSEVRRIPLSAIAPAPELSQEQRRIIRKVANLESEKRMILLLDVVQLLNADEVKQMNARMQ